VLIIVKKREGDVVMMYVLSTGLKGVKRIDKHVSMLNVHRIVDFEGGLSFL